MKKILLSFAAIACTLLSNAQLLLNEVYVRPNPNPGHHEYIELINTSIVPQNGDDYSIVTFFSNAAGENGFYVVDVPAVTVSGNGFLVTSSVAPTFQYQNGDGHADFSWNDGNIRRYVHNGTSLNLDNSGLPYDNILIKSNGTARGQNGVYAVFLFKGNTLVDALLANYGNTIVPDYITDMGMLTGPLTYDFSTINDEADELFNNVHPEAGTDNGYHRVNRNCTHNGVWKKSASLSEHTPGMPNPNSRKDPNPSQMIQADLTCVNSTTVAYNITAAGGSIFPIDVTLYHDANGNMLLDETDVLIGTQTDASVNDPAKTFTKSPGMEDFLFVFQGEINCYDTIMTLNCPAGVVLPVTYRSFTAVRSGDNVNLRWETATEVNSKGFNIERNTQGRWETVAFVGSQASGGNSNSVLNYTFNDVNTFSGVTQYRLRQVDIDGRNQYSDIRTVKGNGLGASLRVYPNPTSGVATIAFDGSDSSRDVIVSDMNGRIIQQYRGISNSSFRLTTLLPGVYMVKVVDQQSGSQFNERLVVSGR